MEDAIANLSLQPASEAPTLLSLPTEILIQITQNLCLHCCHPRIGEVPHDEAATAIREQTALANLSAASKHLRAIAQPVLFHFFHCLEGYVKTRHRLTCFIRTMFDRPDLATCVKSLVLWTPNDNCSPWEIPEKDSIKNIIPAFPSAAEKLGPWWVGREFGHLISLQELAIALASEATYVLLQRRFLSTGTSTTTWTSWDHPLDNLRHLVLVGWRYKWPRRMPPHTYHIKEAEPFLRHARNLESLVAVECGGDAIDELLTAYDDWKARPWDVELPSLRKLSINGENIGPTEVEAIIRHSTVFEDLELFQNGGGWDAEALDADKHLGTAKKTLRRLCYSAFPIKDTLRESDVDDESYEISDEEDDKDYFNPIQYDLNGFRVGLSLKDFSVLETLEVEQLVLYGPVFEQPHNVENDHSRELVSTEEFLSKLPPSLKRLRIGCIFYWPIMFRDMLAMAAAGHARFPNLRSVTLEVRRAPARDDFDCLIRAFQEAGIALSILFSAKDPFSRGLLPTRPGYPTRLPQPVSYS
ncbi:hypothetical protein VTJ49DRAFT_3089 [Mycothermus thermophilus]|uniref:F-box domain-containing protein n=1 Tax=Humicola insolens TaxID=85995 RepID=A0ABR3V8I3_HUMIN